MNDRATSRCPVCRATFRGTVQCSRCGADLTRLMKLEASAHRAREAAREALRNDDFAQAAEFAAHAQWLQPTPIGERLRTVAELLCESA